ncbi:MAG: ATP-dependent DNA ligase, partial [Proteobacteria bacterium]|nr:ATP-dependent DNA ligase [Pseudomonadota bacterium]
MIRFAALLENLLYAPGRNTKIEHLVNWFHTTPMPDLGWGLAALVGEFDSHRAKPALIRQLVESRVDAELFALSYDFVGDMAETVALIWPKENISKKSAHSRPPRLSDIAEDLATTANQSGREATKTLIANWLDTSDATTRWGLLKLITGGLRVGASARLVRLALAKAYDKPVEDIEEIWPLLSPPYHALFDWLNDNAPRPNAEGKAVFRPLMLAYPLKDSDINTISPDDWMVEWKWDGARVQLASGDDGVR